VIDLSAWHGEAHRLAGRIAARLRADLAGGAGEDFTRLALDIHRHQRAHAPVVTALSSVDPQQLTEIPAVPVGLYKELRVGTVPPGEAGVVFRTSGTTGGGRGEHVLRSTALYDLGALGWARAAIGALPDTVVALLSDPAAVPDASLSHMVGLFGARRSWHVHDGKLDGAGARAAVRAADGPVFLAATAFALAEWLGGPVQPLPAGSTVMVTGGFKGRAHRLDGPELLDEAARALRGRVVVEYGMTELSSQLWAEAGEPYRPPPWLVVVAVDPETGAPLPPGVPGQLRFYDLCNLDASIGVETLDEGVVGVDGSVELRGRLAGAEVRGCSLTIEASWGAP
jgi:hypothetical protein